MIELDARGIRELQEGRVVVEIATREVTSLQLSHGFQAERVLLQVRAAVSQFMAGR